MSTETCECCDSVATVEESTTEPTCYCPLDGVFETITKRYSLQLVAYLGANGPTRYSKLEDRLAVTSSSTFADRLEELADEKLIERRSFDEVPPRVEYSLTPRGRELEERIQPLLAWARDD